MPTLSERLEADYKAAMKAGQRVRIDTVRMVKAAMQRAAIDKRKDALDDAEVLHIIGQQVKQRRETIESAKQTSRQDVLTQATEELELLMAYLPQQLAPEAVKQLIEEAVASVGTNQGQVMNYVMGKAAGAADGKMVSHLVGERLKTAR